MAEHHASNADITNPAAYGEYPVIDQNCLQVNRNPGLSSSLHASGSFLKWNWENFTAGR